MSATAFAAACELPPGYPVTGHARELLDACEAGGVHYTICRQGRDDLSIAFRGTWYWQIAGKQATVSVLLDGRGYFREAWIGIRSAFRPSPRNTPPTTARQELDRLLYYLRHGGDADYILCLL